MYPKFVIFYRSERKLSTKDHAAYMSNEKHMLKWSLCAQGFEHATKVSTLARGSQDVTPRS